MDIGRRSRQTAEEKEEEGGEVPSFQNAFNEALFSASVSVLAAQSGELLPCGEVYILPHHIFSCSYLLQHLVGSLVARQQRKVERSLCCSPREA